MTNSHFVDRFEDNMLSEQVLLGMIEIDGVEVFGINYETILSFIRKKDYLTEIYCIILMMQYDSKIKESKNQEIITSI